MAAPSAAILRRDSRTSQLKPVRAQIVRHILLYYPFRGVSWIAKDLGVWHRTVRRTLEQLQHEVGPIG